MYVTYMWMTFSTEDECMCVSVCKWVYRPIYRHIGLYTHLHTLSGSPE